jgi:Sec-independent protein translocase protein TatA
MWCLYSVENCARHSIQWGTMLVMVVVVALWGADKLPSSGN